MKADELLRQKCEALALHSLGGMSSTSVAAAGLKYRKGKTWADVVQAVRKGFAAGSGRTECELDMVACYLEGVLKTTKSPKS